jgi:hypothetical protein
VDKPIITIICIDNNVASTFQFESITISQLQALNSELDLIKIKIISMIDNSRIVKK